MKYIYIQLNERMFNEGTKEKIFNINGQKVLLIDELHRAPKKQNNTTSFHNYIGKKV